MLRWHTQTLLIAFAFCATTPGEDTPHLQGWEALSLDRYEVTDVNVYLEAGLESLLPAVRRHLQPERQSELSLFQDPVRREALLATINRILGINDPNVEQQHRAMAQMVAMVDTPINPLYLVRQTTVKDLLRAGKSVPGFRYDPNKDVAIFEFQMEMDSQSQRTAKALIIPVPEDPNEDHIARFLNLAGGHLWSPGFIIHEITEITLLKAIQPTDPFCRWFSDGFAEAITLHVMTETLGTEPAREYAEGRDPAQYAHMEKQINLRYWMALSDTILDNNPPLEILQNLNLARYSYATLEAQGLIERHGLSMVARIVRQFRQQASRGGKDLFATIEDLTGEDLALRFQRYQDFSDDMEGKQKCVEAFSEATGRQDYAAMVFHMQCLDELSMAQPNVREILEARKRVASLLYHLGHTDYAIQTMQRCIKNFERRAGADGRCMAEEKYMEFALSCDRLDLVQGIADQHIKDLPGWMTTVSRIVKMVSAMKTHDVAEAQRWAKTVINSLPDPKNPIHKQAQLILSMQPGNKPVDSPLTP